MLSFNPENRVVWITENSIIILTVLIYVILYWRGIRFSNTAYTLTAVFIGLHTIGGHYTFELAPFEWVKEIFGFERNHFDRVCHFWVGTFAFPVLEYCDSKHIFRTHLAAGLFVIMGVFGFAAIFEMIEWGYAEWADPVAGQAFLGSQGDIWDAQKDMLCDGIGAICTTILYALLRWKDRICKSLTT